MRLEKIRTGAATPIVIKSESHRFSLAGPAIVWRGLNPDGRSYEHFSNHSIRAPTPNWHMSEALT